MQRSFSELQRTAHEVAKSKGWYDPEPRPECVFANLHSEASEAWEEYRKGAAVTTELADFVIRVADYTQHCGLELAVPECVASDVSDLINSLHEQTEKARWHFARGNMPQFAQSLGVAVGYCFAFARNAGVDLWDTITLKQEYNKTRPYRHGGKVA